MRYYRAYETDNRPFLLFELVADSLQELEEIGLDADPLVVTEDQLMNPADPDYISYEYGICHKRIFGGVIADRLTGEITAQQTALNAATQLVKTKEVEAALEVETFTYASRKFPLTPSARSVYTAIVDGNPASTNLITTTGSYTLLQASIPAFKAAYYAALFAVNDTELPE